MPEMYGFALHMHACLHMYIHISSVATVPGLQMAHNELADARIASQFNDSFLVAGCSDSNGCLASLTPVF